MDNSYRDVTEEAVVAKFKVILNRESDGLNLPPDTDTFLLAWTTTPWTLPGNVALAINPNLEYGVYERGDEAFIVAVSRAEAYGFGNPRVTWPGSQLRRVAYEPLYEIDAMKNAKSYKVYGASFVTATDGTGIVHTAVVYGEDDYNLGIAQGLPIVPMLDGKGIFNEQAPEFLRGQYFKKTDALVIADLESRPSGSLVFKKEKYTHSYPHCWRCGTALYYSAIPAWFVDVQKIKKGLLETNESTVNWYPAHLKRGRYAKSVEQAPDWNISRNRYWGNPIPVWKCENADAKQCPPVVVGSIKELGLDTNMFYFARHGEARTNVLDINSSWPEKEVYDLTDAGVTRAKKLAKALKEKGGIDMIFASDLLRTKHTAEIPFVFGNLLPKGFPMGGPYTDADKKISADIQQYWTNFAKTGNPNGNGLPEWPKFNATARPYLEFTLHDGPQVKEGLRRNICDLYIEALKETIPAGTVAAYPE